MNGYIEITKKQFNAFISNDEPAVKIIKGDGYSKYFYDVYNLSFMQHDNYNSFCTQYYIQDINA